MQRLNPILCLLACLALGCGEAEPDSGPLPVSELPERFLLNEEPEGVLDVAEARAAALQGERIAVRGIVGGSPTPFVNGLAAFTLVDPGLVNVCLDEDDHCPTPWDYCCVDPKRLLESSVTVEFRDGTAPVPAGARGFHGLDHLSQVVVAGRAELDARGNVTVVATGLHLSAVNRGYLAAKADLGGHVLHLPGEEPEGG